MDSEKLFGTTIDLAGKALDLRSRKHQLLLSNIANADTPGYKAFDLLVEEAMNKQTSLDNSNVRLRTTNAAHLTSVKTVGSETNPIKIHDNPKISLRGDGNSVDMEREMTNMAANQIMYEASTKILSSKFRGMKTVIQGGSR